jgi:hypothetical protein
LTKGTHTVTVNSSAVLIDDTVAATAVFDMDIDAKDLLDKSKSMKVSIYVSDDNVKWSFCVGYTWVGQALPATGQTKVLPPKVMINYSEIKGKYIKAVLDTTGDVITDLTLEAV